MPVPFTNVDSFFLSVSDIENAVKWYTEVLDCKLIWRNDEGGFAALSFYGHPITLAANREGFEHYPAGRAPFNLYTSDIEQAQKYLQDKGVETGDIEEMQNARWFWFRDPDGNRLEACTYNRP